MLESILSLRSVGDRITCYCGKILRYPRNFNSHNSYFDSLPSKDNLGTSEPYNLLKSLLNFDLWFTESNVGNPKDRSLATDLVPDSQGLRGSERSLSV